MESPFNRSKAPITFAKMSETVEQRTYGANLCRFRKKARDWRSERRFAQAPTIVMLGDSIAAGSWAEDFKTWLCDAYNIPVGNFKIRAYGGYDVQAMLPFIDEMLIFPNPDLILFGEYESDSAERLMAIENLISLVRDRTTADIGIYTWSMTDTIAEAYLADKTTLIDDSQYQAFNWYRDIAGVYNCELIDFNEAVKNALDAGYSIADIGLDGPHLSSAGYTIVHLPEIKKHFGLSNNQLALSIPYPIRDKEEILYLANAEKMELFDYSDKITLTGTWTTDNISLASSSIGDTIEIEMENIVGFEILHGDDAGASIQLKESGGTYAAPSTFQLNNRPLQYISEIIPTNVRPDDWGHWKFKLPFKKGIITANELANTIVKSGRYTINVNTVVGATVTCEMFDPDDASLGTFTVGQAATFTAGNLSFPKKYNGEDNYRKQVDFVVDEKYEFHIHNNWCDSLLAAEGLNITEQPPNTIFSESPNIAEVSSNKIFHFKWASTEVEVPYMMWKQYQGVIAGHTYKVVYRELTREGAGHVCRFTPSYYVYNNPYDTDTFVAATSPYPVFIIKRHSGEFFDLTFTLSVTDLAGSLEYEDTKKVYGLPRDDYVLKATVTAGGVDLFGVRLLH